MILGKDLDDKMSAYSKA